MAFYGLGDDFVERYRERIEAVSPDGVMRVARKYFLAEGNLIVIMTDYAVTRDQLEGLGDVKVIPIDDVE